MKKNAMKEEFEHIELYGQPALYTSARIERDTVPKGWFCYDLRGSDYDPDRPIMLEHSVVVNHAGTVLSSKLLMQPDTERRRIGGNINFLSEIFTLKDFCEEYKLALPENNKYDLRPASPDEAGLVYALPPEKDMTLATIGHLRIDLGRGGKEL